MTNSLDVSIWDDRNAYCRVFTKMGARRLPNSSTREDVLERIKMSESFAQVWSARKIQVRILPDFIKDFRDQELSRLDLQLNRLERLLRLVNETHQVMVQKVAGQNEKFFVDPYDEMKAALLRERARQTVLRSDLMSLRLTEYQLFNLYASALESRASLPLPALSQQIPQMHIEIVPSQDWGSPRVELYHTWVWPDGHLERVAQQPALTLHGSLVPQYLISRAPASIEENNTQERYLNSLGNHSHAVDTNNFTLLRGTRSGRWLLKSPASLDNNLGQQGEGLFFTTVANRAVTAIFDLGCLNPLASTKN